MSFFDSFFGKAQQRDLSNANQQAQGYINQYGQQSRDAYAAGAKEAQGYFSPWSESGRRGQSAYEDSLGLNGEAGGKNALAMYQAGRNPYLQYEQDMAQRGMDRAANARGSVNSGANALAVARARQDMGYQDYSNWQGRLQGIGQQGYQADTQRAGIAQNAGQYQAESLSGQGQQLAGNAINYGNALAASRTTGINNLINVAGVGLKASGWGGYRRG
jgi:hypothetical protein